MGIKSAVSPKPPDWPQRKDAGEIMGTHGVKGAAGETQSIVISHETKDQTK